MSTHEDRVRLLRFIRERRGFGNDAEGDLRLVAAVNSKELGALYDAFDQGVRDLVQFLADQMPPQQPGVM